MSYALKISIGVVAIALAWVVVFRSQLIFKVNSWMRDYVFSDHLILFSGRRVAFLLLGLGVIALFSGIQDVTIQQEMNPLVANQILDQARMDFREGRYTKVINRCKELVRANPKNVEAWELLANAWWAVGKKKQAEKAVAVILRLRPDYALGKASLGTILGKKDRHQ